MGLGVLKWAIAHPLATSSAETRSMETCSMETHQDLKNPVTQSTAKIHKPLTQPDLTEEMRQIRGKSMLVVLVVSGLHPPTMSLCINPTCTEPDHPGNDSSRICQSCGTGLILQDRYRVMRLINQRSGFGRVYEAYERNIPKLLKVLKPAHNHNPKAVQLFQQEAQVLAELHHPGVPKVEDEGYFQVLPANNTEPLHCMVMEKIDGPNLREWMRQQGYHPISEKQALEWLQQITDVLHLVHAQHYFHRDIKPENIMLRSNGQLVLVDFGAARAVTETYMAHLGATGGMTRISSAGYTPPEQEKGQAVPQSDFYALGWTFIYLLTGKQPTDTELYDALHNTFHWRSFAPQISPTFADFIDYLIAPTAAQRPRDTAEILAALPRLTQPRSMEFQETVELPNLPENAGNNEAETEMTVPISDPILSSLPYANRDSYAPLEAAPRWVATPPSVTAVTAPQSEIPRQGSSSSANPEWNWLWLGSGLVALMLAVGAGSWWWVGRSLNPSTPNVGSTSGFGLIPGRPSGQLLKPTQQLVGHDSFINTILFSPDGSTLFSAGADRTIVVWNRRTGEPVRTLSGHTGFVNVLALSGNGQWLVSGGADNKVLVWDWETGELLHTLTGHTSPVNTLAFSPNNILASAGADNMVRLWDVQTGAFLRTLSGHGGIVNALAISPDGKTLAAAGAASEIVLWDMQTGAEVRQFEGYADTLNTILFTPDGTRLIAGGTDRQIHIWNVQTAELEQTLDGESGYVNRLAIQGDGRRLVSSDSDGKLYLWDLSSRRLIETFRGDGAPLDHVVVSPDWHTLATGRGFVDIRLWDTPPIITGN